ncbi:uncharacterized protein SCODWIG_01239 [Saccharomycodes ludwigii]|uniref:PA14 domain-containing protein n=1 Tax=Saccharomycodes ludwigii TaxID=36035 RepID=A0A376B463_9ASCO|nr:uncharacterized protein SCODWIG_01239 [Saccharomycodes ludwigii]
MIILNFSFIGNVSAEGTENLGTIGGCLPSLDAISKKTVGFNVKFYNYHWLSYNDATNRGSPDLTTYATPAYYNGGYLEQGQFGETNGAISFDYTFNLPSSQSLQAVKGQLPSGYNYDQPVYLTNWTFVATGYFLPTISGSYKFTIGYVDDLAIVSIGGGTAYDCCMASDSSEYLKSYQINSIWSSSGPTGVNNLVIDLVAGVYYPIRLFHTNRQWAGGLTFGYTDPNGNYTNYWNNTVYTLPDAEEVCNATTVTTTVPWGQSYTTTKTTVQPITISSTTKEVINVIVETPQVVSTTTKKWTGSFTSTYATSLFTTTRSDGVSITSTVIYVETPNDESTTYTPWTGAFTSTIGTSVTTSIGSDGIPTTSTIYTVETPTSNDVSTTYTPWTGAFTSTIGTSVTTSIGSDGIPTTSTIYTVETPEVDAASTTYTPWTGAFTSTIGTSVTTSIGSDGIPTTSTIYTVETPTSNDYWIRRYSNHIYDLHS